MVLLSFACNGSVACSGKVACGSFSGELIEIQIFQLIAVQSTRESLVPSVHAFLHGNEILMPLAIGLNLDVHHLLNNVA